MGLLIKHTYEIRLSGYNKRENATRVNYEDKIEVNGGGCICDNNTI